MQTVTEHLTQSDFEVMPVGTGAELARLNDRVQVLVDALADMLDTALACDDVAWSAAIDRAETDRPCDTAAAALEKVGRLPE